MTNARAFVFPDRQGELARLRGEHGNIALLLLVLESHLAVLDAGESFDVGLVHDAVTYLVDYIGHFHRVREDSIALALAVERPEIRASAVALSEQHDALQASGTELRAQLEAARLNGPLDRRELRRLGFAYCTQLRRSMSLEEATLWAASKGAGDSLSRPALAPPAAASSGEDEQGYRARFDELARRSGCDCVYTVDGAPSAAPRRVASVPRTTDRTGEPHVTSAHLHLQSDQLYPFDARGIAKRFRHSAIFGALDALRPGETMRFCNDHDPLPLLDQLQARYGASVEVDYVKRVEGEVVIDFAKKA